MKHIYLNLKRFDTPVGLGGVNRLAPPAQWGAAIVCSTQQALLRYDPAKVEFVHFLPEAHLIGAVAVLCENSPVRIGCQGVYRADTSPGGNFGAFTTHRTASIMKAIGCTWTLIGHCEERNDKKGVLAEAHVQDSEAVNRLLNGEVLCAQRAGLDVLYCIGETSEEQPRWEQVLGEQLEIGLSGADRRRVVIGYEPVWSIGPGKIPADRAYIEKVARFIKAQTGGMDVVYGGGLKADNAEMLASIPEVDGGLIALTRFTGEIGFYPEEYQNIVRLYLGE